MGTFSNNALTDAGRVLLAECQMGAIFTPTKIVMGSGFLPSGTTARTITQVVAPVKTLSINKKQKANDGTVIIGGVYSNAEVTQDFYFRELALFAKAVKADDTETAEVLYSYGNAGNTADLMPAYTTGTIVERQIDLATYIGNDTEIDLTLASGIYVTFDDIEGINEHIGNKNNPHNVTAAQVGAIPTVQKGAAGGVASLGNDGKIPASQLPDMNYDPAGSAAAVQQNLNTHTANKNNPHGVTAAQAGADPAGSAAAVQSNLTEHIGNKNNPHNVTAAQVGADPEGSAAAVQNNLNTHANNKSNPHGVTAEQVGADPAGSAAAAQIAVQQALNAHENNKENPHNVTASQVGADPAGSAAAVEKKLNISKEVAEAYGLDPETATPNDTFNQILPLYPKIGKIMRTFGDAPDNHWIKLVYGTTYFTPKTPELYDAIKVDKLSTTEVQDLGATTLISHQPISMGYMNGYWYDLADNNYDNKLVFKEDVEGSSWNKVTEADFNIPEDERTRLYYTRDLIYFDGKYFISGNGTIFESVDLKKWTISSRVFDTGEHNGIICDHFHLTPDKTILYGCFTGNSQSRVVWRELGGTWNVTDSVNMYIYDVFMRPDKTMIAFGTESVYTSTSISDIGYTKLCSIGRNINYIEYINDLKCYIASHRTGGYTIYSIIEEFTKDTSSSSFHNILTSYRYPENPNVFYDSFNKIIWTLGNTSTNADESYVYYVEAATLEELKANAYKQISGVISVDYMYLARVRPKNNQVIFVKRTYSSGNSAYYSLREFAKSVTIQDREPTYILAYDLRKPAPIAELKLLSEPQTDDIYTELAKAIRQGVNSI